MKISKFNKWLIKSFFSLSKNKQLFVKYYSEKNKNLLSIKTDSKANFKFLIKNVKELSIQQKL